MKESGRERGGAKEDEGERDEGVKGGEKGRKEKRED